MENKFSNVFQRGFVHVKVLASVPVDTRAVVW